MKIGTRNNSWIFPLIAAMVFLLVAGSAVWSVNTHEPTSAFTPGSQGPRPLLEDAQALDVETKRLLSGPLAFRADARHEPTRTLLVIHQPELAYSPDEAQAIDHFLQEGGRLLLIDDYGQSNSLSTAYGITFERVRLHDEQIPHTAVLDRREFLIHTARQSAIHLQIDRDVHQVVTWSSDRSYLDRDGDGLIQADNGLGPFPLIVAKDVGPQGGRLIATSLPDLFHTEHAEEADNRRFRQALIDHLLPDGGTLVLDESRTPSPDPLLATTTAIVGTATQDPWRYVLGAITLTLFVIGMALVVHGEWAPHRFSVDHFIRRIQLRSPKNDTSSRIQPGAGFKVDSYGGREDVKTYEATETEGVSRQRPAARWSRRGRAALLGGLVLSTLGLVMGNLQATYAGAFLLGAVALAVWGRPVRMIAGRTFSADRIHEEMTTRIELAMKAETSTEVEVRDELPRELEPINGYHWFKTRLSTKAIHEYAYEVRGALRGPYAVGPLKVRTSDPFRLRFVDSHVLPANKLLVIPRHKPLSRIPFKSKTPLLTMGPHLVNRAGDGTEFHALRDYQSGDSIRIVNWKASARSKDLVVNQRVHESMATITVFLDARAVTGAGHARKTPLNEGCRAVLSIVTGALQARDKVRVFVYGDGVRELCPDSSTQKAYEMSKAMAELEPRGSTSFLEAVEHVLPGLKGRTPVVLVSPLEGDPSLIKGLKALSSRQLLPFVLALEIGVKPNDPDDGGPEPEAQRLLLEREEAMKEIRGADVPVVPVVPGIPLTTLFQVGVT